MVVLTLRATPESHGRGSKVAPQNILTHVLEVDHSRWRKRSDFKPYRILKVFLSLGIVLNKTRVSFPY